MSVQSSRMSKQEHELSFTHAHIFPNLTVNGKRLVSKMRPYKNQEYVVANGQLVTDGKLQSNHVRVN